MSACSSASPQTWRYIPLLEADGATQMAIDKWLLAQHLEGNHPPTLRFYTWNPITISLGYHQRRYPEFWHDLHWQGKPIDLVRRPTGGRAVLHQGDLSYTIVTSGITGKTLEVYQFLSEFLIEGWRPLGINLNYGKVGRGYIHHPSCFGTATGADLVDSQGNKLIGSAQLRRGKAILQHGSMYLSLYTELFEQVFNETIQPVKIPLEESGEELINIVEEKLQDTAINYFEIELVNQPLTTAEWQEIKLITEVGVKVSSSY